MFFFLHLSRLLVAHKVGGPPHGLQVPRQNRQSEERSFEVVVVVVVIVVHVVVVADDVSGAAGLAAVEASAETPLLGRRAILSEILICCKKRDDV